MWRAIPADMRQVTLLRREIRDLVAAHTVADADLDSVELALSEVLTNAVEHGGGPIWVSVDLEATFVRVSVRDLGRGFDADRPPPAPRPFGGRGLYIAARVTRSVTVTCSNTGSCVTLELDVPGATRSEPNCTPSSASGPPPPPSVLPAWLGPHRSSSAAITTARA